MDRSATKRRGRGGKRPGAGRPAGSKNTLPLGAVSAIRALRHRVPADAPKELADVAGEAFDAVVEVMRGEFRDSTVASTRLRAAAMVREEVCGPMAQKLEHTGKDGGPLVVEVVEYLDEPATDGGEGP